MSSNTAFKVSPTTDQGVKDELIRLQQLNAQRAKVADENSNLDGWKFAAFKMHYMREEQSQFIANCSAEVVIAAALEAGMVKLSKDKLGQLRFHTITNGEIQAKRVWPEKTLVEKTVREYCEKNGINGKGLPLAK